MAELTGALRGIANQMRALLGGVPAHVQVAALPWRRRADGKVEILLVTSRGTGRWVLPKGWPEGKEAAWEAAAREAAEEAGVSGRIEPREIGRYRYGKALKSGMEKRCEVIVIPLEVQAEAEHWPEEDERVRRWLLPQDAAKFVREDGLSQLLAAFSPNKAA